ncbi:uncharacterized protein LAESUDRAFT_577952 [Laetiporus sulphureus 93-53]|uniref:Uncharacterized protein n=1 Tax=Laetiporus sulphureus 93-53 TaxID=1314785 RepID=A0A165B193_9APHY|nr:uncharacterized protein LAESUDRAFT_577952 [Laetiporus sulphureus 93-53]KZT00037.1 hypothetical protein LAESUDRAFT_577952 [Laetiporus sulphureus 93-53]
MISALGPPTLCISSVHFYLAVSCVCAPTSPTVRHLLQLYEPRCLCHLPLPVLARSTSSPLADDRSLSYLTRTGSVSPRIARHALCRRVSLSRILAVSRHRLIQRPASAAFFVLGTIVVKPSCGVSSALVYRQRSARYLRSHTRKGSVGRGSCKRGRRLSCKCYRRILLV